ncbi:hypothetical protein BJV74DRAFT_796808 [Russula compacta]|nr:hypothetical protein BJV74DRAFT_796808 [Russula compacta]
MATLGKLCMAWAHTLQITLSRYFLQASCKAGALSLKILRAYLYYDSVMSHFPCADIYELLSLDILHQLIKGMFKDHLVTWVEEYLILRHRKVTANEILDDIDRQIAIAPHFLTLTLSTGVRIQTVDGDDSKALMKLYILAIWVTFDRNGAGIPHFWTFVTLP